MADYSILSRLGQANGAGSTDELFLKQATGEIMAAFQRTTEFSDKHVVRTITQGKSAQFLATGRSSNAAYHVPGTEIAGGAIPQNEKVITIDDVLLTSLFISNIDEAKAHYDVRSEYTGQMGEELGQVYDSNVAAVGILNARSASTVTGLPGGSRLVAATMKTDSSVLAKAHFDAAETLDSKNVPSGDRFSFLRPAQYYLLAQDTNIINKDWDGRGSYADGKVLKIADIPLVKTNNLPNTNVTTGNAKYQGNFTTTAGLIQHRAAVGTVKLVDMAVEMEYQIRYQGTLMVARYAVGHGGLRPECGIELATAAL
jgi:hypothetical protein